MTITLLHFQSKQDKLLYNLKMQQQRQAKIRCLYYYKFRKKLLLIKHLESEKAPE